MGALQGRAPWRLDAGGPSQFAEVVTMLGHPTEEEIRVRAYHLYLERGAVEGAALDDWLRAEHELNSTGAGGDGMGAAQPGPTRRRRASSRL